MKVLASLAIFSSVGCQPWYRLDEIAGREALDTAHTDGLLARARSVFDGGKPQEAADLALEAIEIDPGRSAADYLALATYLEAAGRAAEARAAVRWKIEHAGTSDSGVSDLIAWLDSSGGERVEPAPLPTPLEEPAFAVDGDGDGLVDGDDQCPMEMEDRDGYLDEDGCPEAESPTAAPSPPPPTASEPPPAPPPPTSEDATQMRRRTRRAPRLRPGETRSAIDPRVATARVSCGNGGPGGDVVYRLEVDRATDVRIAEQSELDALVEVRRADGGVVQCVDDTADTQHAVIAAHLERGRYVVVVDSVAGAAAGAITLTYERGTAAPATPPAPASTGGLDLGARPTAGETRLPTRFRQPVTAPIRAGGPIDAGPLSLGSGCSGHASGAPTFRFELRRAAPELRVSAVAGADTTLLVHRPDGTWACNDDEFGVNPAVDMPSAAPGRYDVWVATYANGETDGTLEVSPRFSTPRAFGALDPAEPPVSGEVRLARGFAPDPRSVSVRAGGPVSAEPLALGENCKGHTTAAPSYRVRLSESLPELRFFATGSSDTTLLVRIPSGTFACNDDRFDTNPGVDVADAPAGTYDVWVGLYSEGAADATLHVTSSFANQP